MDSTKFNIDSHETRTLKAIFNQMINHSATKGIKHGDYAIDFEGEEVSFTLTHDVLTRPRKNNTSQKRIEILKPNPFAQGGGSDGIHANLGVLIPENDLEFKEKSYYKTRSCKYVDTDSVNSPSEITLEAKHTQYNKKLHCKDAILDEDFEYIVMRRMRENNLYELLERIKKGATNLTIETRLQLTYAILIAYKKRVHAVGLVHGDIKSENIMVDWINNKATIIDYGFARLVSSPERDDSPYGSYGFTAPEVLYKEPHTQESDLYSLAMAIAELWGDTSIDDAEDKNLENIENHMKYVANRTWDKLFTKIQLSNALKSDIRSVLKNLSHNTPSERNLEKAIADWEILQNNHLKPQEKEPNPHHFFNISKKLPNNNSTPNPIISEKENSSKMVTSSRVYQVF